MRLKAVLCVVLAGALSSHPGSAGAETFPSKPIRIIVPFASGGATDFLARAVGGKLAERLGQPVVVENKAGASGQIGLLAAAQSPPDGYTIGVGAVTNLSLAPHTYAKLPYDPLKSFAPVALAATNYLALVARPDAPFRTVPEMVQWAKDNPGKLNVGMSGVGNLPHLAFEALAQAAGFTFVNVPYPGDARSLADLMGGQVDVSFTAYTSAATQASAGNLRLLGISSPARDPDLPALPTIGESVKGFAALGWFGFVVPAKTPPNVVDKLNREINFALELPDLQKSLRALGLTPAPRSPEQFGKLIRLDSEKFGKLASAIQFRPQ